MRIATIALFSFSLSGLLSAATITYTPAATTDTGWNACGSFAGYTCRTTANFDTLGLNTQNDGGTSGLFDSAFSAWNTSVGGGWTLANGGDLTGTLDVTTATAQQFSGVTLGGLTINIDASGVTLPTVPAGDSLVWAQGLFDNYLLDGSVVTPFYEMDVVTGACNVAGPNPWCPPAYPFQYADNHFYDQPKTLYLAPGSTQAFFDANAYLSVLDPTAKTLTVYDGVSYGFQNYVSPEPAVWLLCASGLLVMSLLVRRNPLAA